MSKKDHIIIEYRTIEDAIAWAAQHDYTHAEDAAKELGKLTGREMYPDQVYYNSHAWRDKVIE